MRAMQIVAATSTVFVLATMLATTPTLAEKRIALAGSFSRATVKKDCESAGAEYNEYKGHYGCVSMDTGNEVDCVKGKCTGTVPRRTRPPRTLAGLLHPPHAGNKDSGSNPPPKRGVHHVRLGGLAKTFGRSTGPTNPNGSLMIKHRFRH